MSQSPRDSSPPHQEGGAFASAGGHAAAPAAGVFSAPATPSPSPPAGGEFLPSPDRGMVLSEHILRGGDDEEANEKLPPPGVEEEEGGDDAPARVEVGGELFVRRQMPSESDEAAERKKKRSGIVAGGAAAAAATGEGSDGAAASPPTAAAAAGDAAAAGGSKKKKGGLAALASKYREAIGGGGGSGEGAEGGGGKAVNFKPPFSPAEGGATEGTRGGSKPPPKQQSIQQRPSRPATPPSPRVVTAPRTRAAKGAEERSTFDTQRHAIWRQHIDRLYDFYSQHFLEVPTSTVAFVPDSRTRFPAEYAMHQLYTGTVDPRAGARNYICAHHCYVPSEIEDEDKELGEDDDDDDGRIAGRYTDVANVLQPVLRVAHDGPVQRLRVNPFIPSLVAARGRGHTMSLYQLADYTVGDVNKPPTTMLRGPRQPGHGLAWSPEEQHLLAATANDGMVFVYDVNANVAVTTAGDEDDQRRAGSSTGPTMGLVGHQGSAYDVSWHSAQHHTLMSCDDAGKVFFWDTRSMSKEFSAEAHVGAAYSCAFHPTGIFAFATCGADGLVRVWDYRKLSRPTYNLVGHRDAVLGMRWAPFSNTVLLSHSADGSVILWDLARADTKPVEGLDEYMRPELTFQHFGHMGAVRDAQWCDHPEDPWTVVSVDDYNTVQLWSPAPNTYNNIRPDEDE